MTGDVLIELEDLTVAFSGKLDAIKEICLTVERGDIFGIIGQSGAGKSTLLRCIASLQTPTHGSVKIDGLNLAALSPRNRRNARQKIGMVFQHYHLFPSKTVFENVAYPMRIHGLPKEIISKRVEHLLRLVGLASKIEAYPSRLSGGEKQRVGIARALACNPVVLLCDEATSALDPKATSSILRLLQSLNEELDLTIVLITHEMEVVKRICNQVAVLDKGRIVEKGPVAQVFSHPSHPTTRHFLEQTGHDIPAHFIERMSPARRLFRLCFQGHATAEPFISRLIRDFPVDVNILLGGIDCLQTTVVGNLIVEMTGKPAAIDEAAAALKNQGVFLSEVER